MSVDSLLEIDCRIRPEKLREFRLNISALLHPSTGDRSRGVLYEDRDEPGHILLVEEWASREELEIYLSSDDFLALLGGFRVLGALQDCRVVDLSRELGPADHSVRHPRVVQGRRHPPMQREEKSPSERISKPE